MGPILGPMPNVGTYFARFERNRVHRRIILNEFDREELRVQRDVLVAQCLGDSFRLVEI